MRWLRGIIASGTLALVLAPALAPSAARANSRPSVVCPQTATAQAVTQTCCGPIVAVAKVATVCCPADPAEASPCTSAITIGVSPNPASEGVQTTISGTLSGTTTVAAQTVDLWEQPAGARAFAEVANTQTNASGAYSFLRKVTTNAQWYVTAATVTSATVSQSVRAAITLRASSRRPAAGSAIKLSGTVAPSHAGERVVVQELRDGHWVTVAQLKLGARSRFTLSRTIRGREEERFRAVLAADARNASSASSVLAVNPR